MLDVEEARAQWLIIASDAILVADESDNARLVTS